MAVAAAMTAMPAAAVVAGSVLQHTSIRVSSAMSASGSRIRFTAIPNRCLWG